MYAVLTALCVTAIVQAADGDLDPTFGVGGEVLTDFAGSADYAYAMVLDGNGKIVVAGYTLRLLHPGSNREFALARYEADGTLDGTFGSGGRVETDFAGGADSAWAVAIHRSGRIVVAGKTFTTASTEAIAVARYHQDGSLDMSFGANGDGKVTTAMDRVPERVSIAIHGSGRILAVAEGAAAGMLIRYNEDGSLDGSLGTGGIVTIIGLRPVDLAVDASGKILVAGDAAEDVALARYNDDGSLDASFGSGGIVRSDLEGENASGPSRSTGADGLSRQGARARKQATSSPLGTARRAPWTRRSTARDMSPRTSGAAGATSHLT